MNTHFLRVWAIATAMVLTGCSGTPVRTSTTAAELAERAVVILSVSHDLEAGGGANAIFYLDQDSYPGRVVMESLKVTFSIPTASDFMNRRGHLYVLEVKPGHHQIDMWQVASAGVRIFPKVVAAPLEFEVRKGDVLYLGNLHAKLSLGHRMLFGGRAANGAVPVVVDRREQDIALAEAKTPALKGKVQVALLTLGPWIKDADTIQHFDPIVAPVIQKK